jgi:hypothetical protein
LWTWWWHKSVGLCWIWGSLTGEYCHVSGVSWLIVTDSGLDLSTPSFTITLNCTITTSHKDCLRLAPFLTGLRVSSIVTDLVLVYESATSLVSALRWLTLTPTQVLNCLLISLPTESLNGESITSGRTE